MRLGQITVSWGYNRWSDNKRLVKSVTFPKDTHNEPIIAFVKAQQKIDTDVTIGTLIVKYAALDENLNMIEERKLNEAVASEPDWRDR